MDKFHEFMQRKVLGIPVLYLAGGFVVILGIVAWKLKPTTAGAVDTSTTDTSGSDTSGGLAPTANPYDTLNPDGDGTVTVVQQSGTATDTTTVKTNSDWVVDGTAWLIANINGVTGTQAQAALQKYIDGESRTYDEENWVNAWIKEGGLPPDGVTAGSGTIGGAPAQKQFSNFPGTHTVKGSNDNDYKKIANLYYGHSDQATFDLVQAANPQLGETGPFAVGSRINVPAYHTPVYYTVTATSMTASQVASKNGISVYQVAALNNVNPNTAVWHKGNKVRVK
jgi:hypothetical protein